jgi:hypothetical protein
MAPGRLQKRYVQGLVSEAVVSSDRAVISGPPAAIGLAASNPDDLRRVRTFEREWRIGQEESANWSLTVAR